MSYNNNQVLTCPRLQETLNNQFLCHTENVKEKLGTMDFVMSPLNTNGVLRKQLNFGPGKKKLVELTFKPRELEEEVGTDTTISCDGGNEPGQLSHTYELPEEGVSRKWTIENEKFRENCDSLDEWIAGEFTRKFDVLHRALNRITVRGVLDNFGNHALTGTSDSVDVTTKQPDNGGDSLGLIETVSEEYLENLSCNTPFVFGSGELYKYFKRIDANCCADRGQDLNLFASQNEIGMIYDIMVKEEFGNVNDFYALAPGAIQPLWWNKFDADSDNFGDDSYKQGVIVDPATGISYDYTAKYDCGKWNFQLALNYDIVAPPPTLFCIGDRLEGVNWITQWTINNP